MRTVPMTTGVTEFAVGQEIVPVIKHMHLQNMSRPLMAGGNPLHYDPEFATKASLPAPIAAGVMSSAYLSEMLTNTFGIEWLRGGSMNVKFIRPLYANDTVTARGRITGHTDTSTGRHIFLEIWCETQRGELVTVGTASVVVR
jgi:acyl dehydratase